MQSNKYRLSLNISISLGKKSLLSQEALRARRSRHTDGQTWTHICTFLSARLCDSFSSSWSCSRQSGRIKHLRFIFMHRLTLFRTFHLPLTHLHFCCIWGLFRLEWATLESSIPPVFQAFCCRAEKNVFQPLLGGRKAVNVCMAVLAELRVLPLTYLSARMSLLSYLRDASSVYMGFFPSLPEKHPSVTHEISMVKIYFSTSEPIFCIMDYTIKSYDRK